MKSTPIFCVLVVLILATGAMAQDRDRGIALYREGKFPEAVSALEAAVAKEENDRMAWIFLGGSYIHTNAENKAFAAFGRTFGMRQVVPPPTYERTVKVTFKPPPRYPRQARMKGSTGKVRVAVEFRSDGKIGFVFSLESTINDDLVQPSIEAAKLIQFEPAIKGGKPVTVINIVEYGYWIA